MKRTQQLFIVDMLEGIESIERFMKGAAKKDFWSDDEKQSAVFRKLEIIGEAATHTTAAFRKKHPKVPWKEICGLRNKIIHEYFGINLERIWNIIKDDLPVLKKQILGILDEFKTNQKKLL